MKKVLAGALLPAFVSARAVALGMPTGAVDPLVGTSGFISKGFLLLALAFTGVSAYRGGHIASGGHAGGHTVGKTLFEIIAGIIVAFGGYFFLQWAGVTA